MDTAILLVILVEVAAVAVIMVALIRGVNKALARPQMDVEEIIAKFLQSKKLRNAYAESINTWLMRQTQKWAEVYATIDRAKQQIEKDLSQGKTIDLSKLATNAQKVAYAVVLQCAQDEVILAETTLQKTRKTIAKTQENLHRNLERGGDLVESYKADLKELKFQEKFCEERAEAARQHLDKLLRQSKSQGGTIKIKIPPKEPQA